jgi:hypothetical protein
MSDELLVEELEERVAVGGLPLGESADAARGSGVRHGHAASLASTLVTGQSSSRNIWQSS